MSRMTLLEAMPYVRWTEITYPCHDLPAVWKSWGLRGGGLPIVESDPLAPVTKPRFGFSADDGLPTLEPLPTQQSGERGHLNG